MTLVMVILYDLIYMIIAEGRLWLIQLVLSLFWIHGCYLAGRSPWSSKSRLPSSPSLSLFFMHWEGNGNPSSENARRTYQVFAAAASGVQVDTIQVYSAAAGIWTDQMAIAECQRKRGIGRPRVMMKCFADICSVIWPWPVTTAFAVTSTAKGHT